MVHRLQEWIHRLEVGEGRRWIRVAALLLGLAALAGLYNWQEYRNFSRPEAMDAAQLARNLARGDGYTTRCIRPLSVHLLEERAEAVGRGDPDPGRLRGAHPDLANPPVYPALLACLFRFTQPDPVVHRSATFRIYPPDMAVTLLNQALMVLLVWLCYGLGRSLFDGTVGWIAAAALALTELVWRFTVSGLPTLLAMVLFTALAWCLVAWDRARRAEGGNLRVMALAGCAGLLAAALGLTIYGTLGLVVPLGVYLATGGSGRGWRSALVAVALLGVLVAPWLARNRALSGHWFGTAGFSVVAMTPGYPEDTVERSLDAEAAPSKLRACGPKLLRNGLETFRQAPRWMGNWVAAFFLVGLMVLFSDPVRARMRWFVAGSWTVLALAQALTRTHLSADGAEVTSENLVVLTLPLVLVFGVALFSVLLESMTSPVEGAREVAVAALFCVAGAPLALSLLPPRQDPRTFPPYHPPVLQMMADWIQPEELLMGDVPWAVAWYGDRNCIWIPRLAVSRDGGSGFAAISRDRRHVAGLYLSLRTLDRRFHSDMFGDLLAESRRPSQARSEGETNVLADRIDVSWGAFAAECLTRLKTPEGFPLQHAHGPLAANGHLFLADSRRWR